MNEKFWNILQYNSEWLRFSDSKASVILTVYGIIITIVYSNSNDVFNAISNSNTLLVFSVLSGLFSMISIFFSFKCINPRLKNLNPSSIIYFGHISEKFNSFEEYFNYSSPKTKNEVEFAKQVAEQIYVNSKIAWKKFYNVSWSIRFFVLTISSLLIQIIFYISSSM